MSKHTDWSTENWCRCGCYITRNPGGPWLGADGLLVINWMGQPHTHGPKYFNRDPPEEPTEEERHERT